MADSQALTTTAQPAEPAALDQLVQLGKAVGDRLRAGILQVLHQESYSVGELCQLFEVPQPALSHHLKILHQAGLVARRREGNNIFYRRAPHTGNSMVTVLLAGVDRTAPAAALTQRIDTIHTQRNERSAEFFTRHAAQISAHQAEICEPVIYADLVLEMIEDALSEGLSGGRALEVGPGGGQLLARLDRLFDATTGVDNSTAMLNVARQAVLDAANVKLRNEDFMSLPRQRHYDALVAAMVVHHQASPASFFNHAAAVLHQHGALVVAELCRHDQDWAAHACGDQWLGFEPEEILHWAALAGFEAIQSQYLAQKNGFRIQIHRFQISNDSPLIHSTTGTIT